MKKMTILATSALVLNLVSCQSATVISRERAIEIAKETAVADHRKLNEYVLGRVAPMSLRGDDYWSIFFEGNEGIVGKHFTVWVDRKTGGE